MPELPEVETVKNGLLKSLPKVSKITKLELKRKDLRFPFPKDLAKKVTGTGILAIKRRAKYLIFELSNDLALISHLGMTGSWEKRELNATLKKHDHLVIEINKEFYFVYNDPRRFGYLELESIHQLEKNKFFTVLGPEPLDDKFNSEYLYSLTKKSHSPIKNLIMNQKTVVGVGNIYAAESLFLSSIRPQKKANKLSKNACSLLVKNIKVVIAKAIEAGGSSISDFGHVDGKLGYFQHQFQVYGRSGKECVECKSILKNIILSGRASVYCPKCQK